MRRPDEHLTSEQKTLVEQGIPMAQRLAAAATRRAPRGSDPDEMRSFAYQGLIRAAQGFDPSLGLPFEAYASSRINGAILDGLRSADWAPRSGRQAQRQMERARDTLGEKATPDQVKAEAGVTPRQHINAIMQPPTSTENILHLPGRASVESDAVSLKTRQHITNLIRSLDPDTKLILALFYYLNLPLQSAARRLNMTEARVSQLHTRAVMKIRDALLAQLA